MDPVVGVILSIALVVAAFGGRAQRVASTPAMGSDEVSKSSNVISRGNVLSVGTQRPGMEIVIDSLVLEESANLVVVRTEEGKPVPLTTIKLPKGSYQKLIVSLDKAIKVGDNLVFGLVSRKTSLPVVDGRGEVMTRTLSVE